MTDHATVFPPGWRLTNTNGDPISGGTVEFYSPGTTTPLTVYSDKDLTTPIGTSLTTDSGGYPSSGGNKCIVYTSTDALKLILKDDAGVSLATHDQWQAFSVTTGAGSGSSLQHVLSKSADFTVASNQSGYVFNCDPTGASFQATLLSSITAGDGFNITIRHDGSTNQVKIAPSISQTIKLPGGSTTKGFSLTGKGHSVTLVADGSGWIVTSITPPLIASSLSTFTVESRATAAPTSPTPGARYIINGSPTGTFATLGFAQHDVVEADGQGGWNKYTPPTDCGWLAYIKGENLLTQFRDSAWSDLSNVAAPTASTLRRMTIRDSRTSGTSAQSLTGASWNTRTLQTVVENTITTTYGASSDASLATNTITLPTGVYLIIAKGAGYPSIATTFQIRNRLRNTTTSTSYYSEPEYCSNSASALTCAECPVIGVFTVSASSENFVFETYPISTALGGITMSLSSINEIYSTVEIIDLSSIQGPQGTTGTQGPTGPGYAATSSTSLSIGTGSKSFTTQTGLAYAAGIRVRAADQSNPTTNYMEGVVTSYSGSSLAVSVDRTAGSGTIAAWNIGVAGDVGPTGASGSAGSTGATGATGATGPNTGLDYAWSTSTSGDPGSGKVLGNNATLASITQVNISKTGRNSESLGAVIATWDDSTNTAHYGHLRIFKVSDRTAYLELEITGTLTDNTTYYSVPVSRTASGGTLSANDILAVMFERTGNKGADGAGSFTSLSPGAGMTSDTTAAAPGSAITTSGTVSRAQLVNAQVGTTYTVVDGDRAKLLTFSNASSVAVTLPQANQSTTFKSGWFVDVVNLGAGTVTITPTTSTISGASSLTLPQNRGCRIVSDGTNYQISQKPLIAGTDYQAPVTAAVLAAFSFGPFTNIASASTTDLSTVATIGVNITGTTTITSFGTGANLLRIGKFAGALTLTHNGTSLILPGAANITTAAGDRFVALSDGSGNWTVVNYTRADGTEVLVYATAGQYQANTANKPLEPNGVWSAAAITTLTDAATITPDFSTGINFTVTLGGTRTMANPTNVKVGQAGFLRIVQDATGSRQLSWGANWKFQNGTAPTLTTAASKFDVLFYQVTGASEITANVLLKVGG